MPMKHKKTYKKKTPKRHSRKSGLSQTYPFPRRNQIVLPQRIGVGQSVNTDLRTSFFANVTGAAGGIFTGYLKPGSAYDPSGDLSTIQPVAYDAWSLVYSRYKVNKAWVTISIIGTGAPAGPSAWVAAAYPAVDPTALTTYQGAASQSYAKTLCGSFLAIAASGLGTGSGEPKSMKFVLDNEAVVGASGDAFDMGALVSADPTALQYAVLPIFLQASDAHACTWMLKVDMYQNVTFSQRKNVVDA